MSDILQVRDLAVSLGRREVLHDVGLAVGGGELVGLIGPNGAGKTTLLRTVLGLLKPARGEVLVNGQPARTSTVVGCVPQRHEFAWEFPISVSDAVLSGRARRIGWFRSARREDHRAVRRALELVGMDDLAERTVGELSGGQRQRVLIARALATEPQLLLLDEPFTGVDVPTQELLTDLFQTLAADGLALVMTTHDLVQAMSVCSRLCLVNRTILAAGTPEELRDPQVWIDTFGMSPASPLLAQLQAVMVPC